jgi:hypothetical protein
MMFYSRVAKIFCVMPKGKVLQFEAGIYATEDEDEIKHLEECMQSAPGYIVKYPVPLAIGDAVVLREVGGGPGPATTGMVSSQALAQLAADSNRG